MKARKTPSTTAERVAELLRDNGVLAPEATLEFFGWTAVEVTGGTAVVPWRGHWLAATGAALSAVPDPADPAEPTWTQAVVHLQKGRAATWWGLVNAWRRLRPGGRLLLCGSNELGIKTAVRRLEEQLDQEAAVVANRARGRVARFTRFDGAGPVRPVVERVQVELAGDHFTLESSIGGFSAGELDPGTRLLLEAVATLPDARRIFDPGCGTGVLALAALRRFPSATAVLADADWRAVSCARKNARDLGLSDRSQIHWWDATREPPPATGCDLVLANPPIHAGAAVDLEPAFAMFRAVDAALAPGGCVLIVALQTLPFEARLAPLGKLRQVIAGLGYKVLEVRR